jgi:hypothetical protein
MTTYWVGIHSQTQQLFSHIHAS